MNQFRDTLKLPMHQWLSHTTLGMVLGITEITVCISYSAMIFSGPLHRYMLPGIGLFLLSYGLINFLMAYRSTLPGNLFVVPGNGIVIISLIAASMCAHAGKALAAEALFASVLAMIAVTSLITGLLYYLCGRFHAGSLVRFLPYPVISGFFTGFGLAFVLGGFKVLTTLPVNLTNVSRYFHGDIVRLWWPGVLIGIIFIWVVDRYKHYLTLPSLILSSILNFFLTLHLLGISMETARATGYLLKFHEGGNLIPIPIFPMIKAVAWPLVFQQLPEMLSLATVTIIGSLMIMSGLETGTNREFVLDTELKRLGVSNLIIGAAGGAFGHQGPGLSLLVWNLGARDRILSVIYGLTMCVLMVTGQWIIPYIPIPVIGGLMIFTGLGITRFWLIDSWNRFNKIELMVVAAIVSIILTWGFLPGIFLGALIACLIFVFRYSRINVCRAEFSLLSISSRVERPELHQQLLVEHGEQVRVLMIQGYLFFGTSFRLLNQIRTLLGPADLPAFRYLILDFSQVTAVDVSALQSFERLQALAVKREFKVIYTGLNDTLLPQIAAATSRDVILQPDLDHGLEWCEARVLESVQAPELTDFSLSDLAALMLPGYDHREIFCQLLERRELAAGEWLFHHGDASRHVFLIESGRIEILLERKDAIPLRLRTLMAGTALGEMGIYSRSPRSASAQATVPTVVYQFSLENFDQLQQTHPAVAAAFHTYIIQRLIRQIRKDDILVKIAFPQS